MIRADPSSIMVYAPAKLNLGLEVLGRRDDGYHELATVFLTVSLMDRLTIARADRVKLTSDESAIGNEDNLILRALAALPPQSDGRSLSVNLQKRIPIAAGLGGASSDAAATLLGARKVAGLACSDGDLARIGLEIGSDVPFFLRGGCAVGHGRGELLESLPVPHNFWFVVVAPRVRIPHKTRTLFRKLAPRDFSDGAAVERQAARLRAGLPLNIFDLPNAFSRPLYELAPELIELPETMREAGASSIAISGAGPTHYAVVDDLAQASQMAEKLRARLGTRAHVFVVAPVPARSADI